MDRADNYSIETEQERESKKILYVTKINKLYDEIITTFKTGQAIVYSPYVFNYLSKEKFLEWLIQNNKDIAKILQ